MDVLERKRKPKEAELKENPSEAVVPAEEGAGGKENEAGPNSARTQNPPPPDAENEEEEVRQPLI